MTCAASGEQAGGSDVSFRSRAEDFVAPRVRGARHSTCPTYGNGGFQGRLDAVLRQLAALARSLETDRCVTQHIMLRVSRRRSRT